MHGSLFPLPFLLGRRLTGLLDRPVLFDDRYRLLSHLVVLVVQRDDQRIERRVGPLLRPTVQSFEPHADVGSVEGLRDPLGQDQVLRQWNRLFVRVWGWLVA